MITIQNKPQNLKTQIKSEKPEDLKRELKVNNRNPNDNAASGNGGSQKRIEGTQPRLALHH